MSEPRVGEKPGKREKKMGWIHADPDPGGENIAKDTGDGDIVKYFQESAKSLRSADYWFWKEFPGESREPSEGYSDGCRVVEEGKKKRWNVYGIHEDGGKLCGWYAQRYGVYDHTRWIYCQKNDDGIWEPAMERTANQTTTT